MSISSFTELVAAIANYGARADTAARAPEFIASVEAKMNRRLRIGAMEDTATGTFTVDDPTVALPTGFLEMRTFSYTPLAGSVKKLSFLTVEQIAGFEYASSAPPLYYTFSSAGISLCPAPDQAYPYTFVYYKKLPALSGSVATNDILTDWPDAYLYGCLAECAAWLRNWDEAMAFKATFDGTVQEIVRSDQRGRYTAPLVQFDASLPLAGGRANILTDGQ